MQFYELPIEGAYRIELEPHTDERGFFARAFCEEEFAEAQLPQHFPQANLSFSRSPRTLRGLHYRIDRREAKLIRCVTGTVYDVVADVRPESPTYGQWTALELSAENRASVFIPPGCAHGHLTLTPEAELLYQMTATYAPEWERGIRWDDPTLAIDWPVPPEVISNRDRELPYLERAEARSVR